mmetsp:Transcript_33183/g.76565  ORF Transcript_33183/g.76565 Transcript_33183/m.76565 type:complete len:80 (-) Transcript_33183:27-266(-)
MPSGDSGSVDIRISDYFLQYSSIVDDDYIKYLLSLENKYSGTKHFLFSLLKDHFFYINSRVVLTDLCYILDLLDRPTRA